MIKLRAPLLVAVASLALGACSSSSNGTDYVSLCKANCEKYANLCYAGMGAITTTALSSCQAGCTTAASSTSTKTCTNAAAIAAAAQACSAKTTCSDLTACEEALPACQGSSGAGGGPGSTGLGGGPGSTGLGGGPGSTGLGGGPGSTGAGACYASLQACCATGPATSQVTCAGTAQAYAAESDAICNAALAGFKVAFCPASSGGLGGATGTGTCLPGLLTCCNRATGASQTSCQEVYTAYAAAGATGEAECALVLPTVQALYCP